jgi:hypothetical protein
LALLGHAADVDHDRDVACLLQLAQFVTADGILSLRSTAAPVPVVARAERLVPKAPPVAPMSS